MRTNGTFALGALLALSGLTSGCYSARDLFRPEPSDAPFVYDIGPLEVVDPEIMNLVEGFDYASVPEAIHYGQLGVGSDPGVYGGATFQFLGTGGDVCVVVDPESMFWNREISAQATNKYDYNDVFEDDGDIDLSVGLTAYYTGSPGVEIGDFNAVYDDPSGVEHELAFNECLQIGLFGDPSHAGRGTIEYCTIDTSLREGISYTALLETFALPIDDSVLNFGVMAYSGSCGSLRWRDPKLDPTEDRFGGGEDGSQPDGIPDHYGYAEGATECVIPNETGNAELDGIVEEKAWFPEMETALCSGKGKLNAFCDENPDGCQPVD